MKNFKILGIEPTKDEMLIKEAYLSKLSNTNPEDKPKEFMELRKAYENAIEYANQEDDEVDKFDDSKIGRWMTRVKEVYENFRLRNDIEAWLSLLKDDVCQNIETKIDARDAMLEFFMENYYIPSDVIRILNDFFNFEEDVEDLYEKFPSQFINNVIIDGIIYDEYPKFDLFKIEDGLDYENFLRDFYVMNSAYKTDEIQKAYELLQELKTYGIYHPELEIKEAFILYNMEKLDEAWEKICSVKQESEQNFEIDLLKSMILLDKGENEESQKYCKKVLETQPENVTALQVLCITLKNEGKFIESREIIDAIVSDGFESDSIDAIYGEVNQGLINDYEAKKNLDNKEIEPRYLLEVADTYYIVDELDKALEIAKSVEINDETDLMVYRLLARINLKLKIYDEALKYTDMWEKCLKNSSQEKLNKFLPKYIKLDCVYYTRAWIYNNKKEKEKALEELNRALEVAPNDIEILNRKNQILFSVKRYEEVIENCNKIIKLNPNGPEAYMAKIKSLYEIDFWGECFEECQKLIYIEPYNLYPYIYKIRVLIQVEEIEVAKEEINNLKQEGVEDESFDFFEALILSYEGKKEKALKIYEQLIENIDEENSRKMLFLDELYFNYLNIAFELEKEIDILQIAEEGLKYNSIHQGLLYYKGTALIYKEEYKDAQEVFEYIAELYPDNGYTDRKIGDIYSEQGLYGKALEYYNKQIEKEYDLEDYFKRVEINIELLNLDDVYKDLVYLEKKLKNNPKVYEYLGVYYNIKDDAQKSYDYLVKAKTIFDRSYDYESSIYLEEKLAIACSRLGMHEEAIKYYRQYYEMTNDPDDLMEIYNQYIMMKDFDNSEKILKEYFKAINKSKISAEALYHTSILNMEKQNVKAALNKISLILKPDVEQKREKAKMLFFAGDNKKALKLMEEVIKEMQFIEDNRNDYIIIARICLELGEKTKAHRYAKKVIESTPIESVESKINILPFNYCYLGNAYAILGEYNKAEQYLNKTLTSPKCFLCTYLKCIDGLYNLAYLEYLRGNLEQAKSYLEEIFEADASREEAIGLAYKLGFLK